MRSELTKKYFIDPGSYGLPQGYPEPAFNEDMLFYIQRNQNTDTIIYQVNRTIDRLINREVPMHAHWINYSRGGITTELNPIQSQLAYGYCSQEISGGLHRFQFVSYRQLDFFLSRDHNDNWRVVATPNGRRMILRHIYVYAVEFGVFPDVKFIEFYGEEPETGIFAYEKISIS